MRLTFTNAPCNDKDNKMKTPYLDSQLKGYRQLAESGKMPESGMEQLKELEAIKEALSIHGVSQQRELFFDLLKFAMPTNYTNEAIKNIVEHFIGSKNCG